jgi:hypothetical protein
MTQSCGCQICRTCLRPGCSSPPLLFGGLAEALDGIARRGAELLKERCRGTLEPLHDVVQPVGAVWRPVDLRERAGHDCAEVLGLLEEMPRGRVVDEHGRGCEQQHHVRPETIDRGAEVARSADRDDTAPAERAAWAAMMATCAATA